MLDLELHYDRTNQNLILIRKIQKPVSRDDEYSTDCLTAFRHYISGVNHVITQIRIIENTRERKVAEYRWHPVLPALSRIILFQLNFNTANDNGSIIRQIHLHNFTVNNDGYHGNISFDCIQIERVMIYFTYSDAVNVLDNVLEDRRFVSETFKPFSYVRELITTQGDNPLHGRNLKWAYKLEDSSQIDQSNIPYHENVTYAKLLDDYGEGKIHIYLDQDENQ